MDMGIDEPGHNETPQRLNRHAPEPGYELMKWPARDDQTFLDDEQAIDFVANRIGMVTRIARHRQQFPAEGADRHVSLAASRITR
jgi:hypothetical protein